MASGIHLRTTSLAKVTLTISLVMTFLLGHGLDAAAMELTHADHQVIAHEIDSSCLLLLKDPAGSDGGGLVPSVSTSVDPFSSADWVMSLEAGAVEYQPSIHSLCVLRV